MLFSPPLHLHLRFVPTIPDLRIFNRTQVRSLPCLVFPSLTNCLRLDRYDPGLWRFRQPFLALPAVVSFDSYVVGIGTKQKPCCWWCQELIWPIFSPLKTILTCFFSPSFWTKLYPLRRVIWFQKSDLTKFSCHFGPFVEEKYFRPIFFAHDPVGTLLEYIIRGRWWMTKGCRWSTRSPSQLVSSAWK